MSLASKESVGDAKLWKMVTDIRDNITTGGISINFVSQNIAYIGGRAVMHTCWLIDSWYE